MSTDYKFNPETATSNLLSLLESIVQRFDHNDAAISRYDSERGDLDHMIELTPFNASEGYKLIKKVKANRTARRVCKDENLVLKPMYDFIRLNNDKLLRDIRHVAKEAEKKKSYRDSQKYHPRSSIITPEEFNRKRVKS